MDVIRSSAKNSPKRPVVTAEDFVAQLAADYPQFNFVSGGREHWSPGSKTITYNSGQSLRSLQCGLLHELAHAELAHSSYNSDLELLKLESQAWHLAAKTGRKYGVRISDDHVQNCLDTYRDWLHRRSRCPVCGANGLQQNINAYNCINCQSKWKVTSDRFARAYRRTAS